LIGVLQEKEQLLTKNQAAIHYLKPSFVGGFRGTQEWISLAEKPNRVVDNLSFID
jgi:hypothetical protein